MNRFSTKRIVLVIFLVSLTGLSIFDLTAVAATPPSPAHPKATAPDETDFDDDALQALKACDNWLAGLDHFTATAEITADEVFAGETKVQRLYTMTLRVRKPVGFRVTVKGSKGQQEYSFDGKAFSLYYPQRNTVATATLTGANEEAIAAAAERFGIVVPLADMVLGAAAYRKDDMLGAYSIGKTEVEGRDCHQILALLDDMDLQLWIQAGPEAMVSKFLLTYHSLPGLPQYSARFFAWDTKTPVEEKDVRCSAPADAAKIAFPKKGE